MKIIIRHLEQVFLHERKKVLPPLGKGVNKIRVTGSAALGGAFKKEATLRTQHK